MNESSSQLFLKDYCSVRYRQDIHDSPERSRVNLVHRIAQEVQLGIPNLFILRHRLWTTISRKAIL
ncbi:hypothetical protein KC717_03545 [Candidatus Dojkabacteria bacterium]|uniref:Uncharacterized protein n=1 Tax=Candidatus Dojkabacteria bacterium TaxID=2099670 RepID=A0A955L8R3_9BACT|nr:hypothetical protein [Candidatus Dojkabacteria bacterium]